MTLKEPADTPRHTTLWPGLACDALLTRHSADTRPTCQHPDHHTPPTVSPGIRLIDQRTAEGARKPASDTHRVDTRNGTHIPVAERGVHCPRGRPVATAPYDLSICGQLDGADAPAATVGPPQQASELPAPLSRARERHLFRGVNATQGTHIPPSLGVAPLVSRPVESCAVFGRSKAARSSR